MNIDDMIDQQELDTEVHKVWTPIEPTTEGEKIVVAVNALNRSLDKRISRLTDAVLLLVKTLERRDH